jgi:CheY-like chemotaxis protein
MSIFKKCTFYRDSESLTVGIGLGHCDLFGQAICEGDIQFCQNPEELKKELLEQQQKELEKNREEGNQKEKLSNYKILVVEDEEPLRKIVVAFLSREGHQCVTASNGIEALSKIHKNKVDAVITDIAMPQMNGINLTRELLSLYPKLPIMVMTGYSKEYPAELAIKAGARDFIGKPFSYDELILRFDKMMSDHESLLQVEAKQKEMFLRVQRESSEKISELQREIQGIRSDCILLKPVLAMNIGTRVPLKQTAVEGGRTR